MCVRWHTWLNLKQLFLERVFYDNTICLNICWIGLTDIYLSQADIWSINKWMNESVIRSINQLINWWCKLLAHFVLNRTVKIEIFLKHQPFKINTRQSYRNIFIYPSPSILTNWYHYDDITIIMYASLMILTIICIVSCQYTEGIEYAQSIWISKYIFEN